MATLLLWELSHRIWYSDDGMTGCRAPAPIHSPGCVHWNMDAWGGWSSGSHLGRQLRNFCHCSGWPDLFLWSKNVLNQNPRLYHRGKNLPDYYYFFPFVGNSEVMELIWVPWLARSLEVCCCQFFKETNNLTSFECSVWTKESSPDFV